MAIATAHLRGERDLVDALARDHLVDHPDSVLVAWIAAASHRSTDSARPDLEQGDVMNRKLTATLLILAAVLANVGFTALGSIFNYPDVLDEPAGKVLAVVPRLAGRGERLVPRARARGRRCSLRSRSASVDCRRSKAMRIAVPVGITAAIVQVVGLLRWPILVPGYASDAGEQQPGRRARRPRHVHDRERRARHRASARPLGYLLTADVDRARRRRTRSSLRRSLVPGAGRDVGGARVRRCVLAARRRRRSTPRTSSATSSGACGSSPSVS